jgi:hypothetical protein
MQDASNDKQADSGMVMSGTSVVRASDVDLIALQCSAAEDTAEDRPTFLFCSFSH